MTKTSALKFALGSLVLAGLTACVDVGWRPPPPVQSLNFSFPALGNLQDMRLAAYYFSGPTDNPKSLRLAGAGYVDAATSGHIYLYGTEQAAADPNCTTPFVGGETAGMLDVSVTPDWVKTCVIYFMLYEDKNRDNLPGNGEEVYVANDQYGYASEAFSYSFRTGPTQASRATESGVRRVGWSLLRHRVIEPEATPGQYKVSMNSVADDDLGIPIQMHERTDFYSSQSVGSRGVR